MFNKKKKIIKNDKIKVCILMNKFHVGANILLNKIIKDPNIEIVSIVWSGVWATSKNKKKKGLLGSGIRWGRKVGHYFLLGLIAVVILHFIQIILLEILLIGMLFKGRNYFKTMKGLAIENNIPRVKTSDINSVETVEYIRSLKPDIILSNNFNNILKKDIIDVPKIGVINVHPGLLPFYRGMLPHFWAMVNGDNKVGVTLHYVDEGVDTGSVISQQAFKVDKNESFYSVWKKTAHYNSNLLKKYFLKLREEKTYTRTKKIDLNTKKSQLFKFPTSDAFLKFKAQGKRLFKIRDFIGKP